MKLSKLVEHIEYELVQGSLDTEVADIAYDSRKMKEGMLFVAIAGTVVDGHKYIPDVVKKGASVLVVEKEIESIDESITVIRVANGRAALSLLSQAYFDYPASMKVSSCGLYIDPPVTHYVPYIPHGYIHHSNVNFSHVSKRRSLVFEKSP